MFWNFQFLALWWTILVHVWSCRPHNKSCFVNWFQLISSSGPEINFFAPLVVVVVRPGVFAPPVLVVVRPGGKQEVQEISCCSCYSLVSVTTVTPEYSRVQQLASLWGCGGHWSPVLLVRVPQMTRLRRQTTQLSQHFQDISLLTV